MLVGSSQGRPANAPHAMGLLSILGGNVHHSPDFEGRWEMWWAEECERGQGNSQLMPGIHLFPPTHTRPFLGEAAEAEPTLGRTVLPGREQEKSQEDP